MDGEHGILHARQSITKRLFRKCRAQPGVDPGIERPAGLVTVVPAQPVELRRFRDHRDAILRVLCRKVERHAAANAVAKGDETLDAEVRANYCKTRLGLESHEIAGHLPEQGTDCPNPRRS